MRIKFSPQRRDDKLTITKDGDKLRINGDLYNFGVVPDGATLPQSAIPGDFIAGPVSRVNGELEITILLPHGPNPPQNVSFPADLENVPDGDVSFPSHFYEPPPEHEFIDPLKFLPIEEETNDQA